MPYSKRIDSPNVNNYNYAFGCYGKVVEHPEGAIFEGAPYEEQQENEFKTMMNSKWKIPNKSAWYTIDSYNGIYDIKGSY